MPLTGRLAWVFVTMGVLLAITLLATYAMGVAVLRAEDEVARRQEVIAHLQLSLTTLLDAETSQRGFLLTHDEQYLAPYRRATAAFQTDLDGLREMAEAGYLSPDDVRELSQLTSRKLDELGRTIDLQQAKDDARALNVVASGEGKTLMDSVRSRMAQVTAHQQAVKDRLVLRATRMTWWRTGIFAGAATINLAFLVWAFRTLRREISGRQQAATEMQRNRDLLAVTLASIGDAVIVTGVDGRITFMNAVSEQLTGWSAGDAIGRPCADVFRIVNEESRSEVESPVEKVLRLGKIVGLANHTLLIRRDGSEVPIDDSGAPIREADGTVRGAVLVFRDFTDHKTAEKLLREANQALENASKAKDHFLATLSHELRTPLTPVLATLTMWEASDDIPAGLRSDVQMLRRNVELEARLIDDLLDLTRIAKGKMPINLEVVDVHDLVHAVTALYESEIRAKNIRLQVALDAERHHVTADLARLQQVFWNVLKNATKFTPDGGSISIRTRADLDERIHIEFEDTGIGMTEATLRRLFQPFEQGDHQLVRETGGLGLGMALSKALLDAQAGEIEASSPGPNLGSTFRVSMRTVRAPSGSSPQQTVGTDRADAKRPARQLRILVVEDHQDTAEVLVRLLVGLGHEARASHSLAEALRAIRESEFDLVLSDIGLPDGTGIDLLHDLRGRSRTPAVALTGFGMDEDIARCREAGFDAHLTKPVNFQKLALMLRQMSTRPE